MIIDFFTRYRDIIVSGLAASAAIFGAGWRLQASFARVHSRLDTQAADTKASSREITLAIVALRKELRGFKRGMQNLGSRLNKLGERMNSLEVGVAELKGEARGRLQSSTTD